MTGLERLIVNQGLNASLGLSRFFLSNVLGAPIYSSPLGILGALVHSETAHAPTKSGIKWKKDLLEDPATLEFLQRFAKEAYPKKQ